MRTLLVPLFLALGSNACGNPTANPHEPGEALGTFQVSANQATNDCGQGALGAPATWTFPIRLSRQGDTLYWINGAEAIAGTLAPDGQSFAFETTVRVELNSKNPCSVLRQDQAVGKLQTTDDTVTGFSAWMSFTFQAEEGHCEIDGLPVLPCAMRYEMTAALQE